MFNFFKKKKKVGTNGRAERENVSEEEMVFLRNIILALPLKYQFLLQQINNDFIVGKKKNVLGEEGSFTFLMDQVKAKQIGVENPYFQLKGIGVFNPVKNRTEFIELDILDNILVGYYAPSPYDSYNQLRIDAKTIYERKSSDNELEDISNEIGKEKINILKNWLNFSNPFLLELGDNKYYIVHDFEDGNYLGITSQGEVYGFFHDPYKVDLVYPEIQSFMEDLKSGKFSLDDYYSKNINI